MPSSNPVPKPERTLSPQQLDDSDKLQLPAHEPGSGATPLPTMALPPLPLAPPLPAVPSPLPTGFAQAGREKRNDHSLPAVSGGKLLYPPQSRAIAAPIDKPPVARKPSQWRRTLLLSIGGAALCTFAFTVSWMAINYKRDSDKIAELPPIPASGVLTPRDAVYRIGEKRTVEFTVGHRQQGDEWVYLYESAPSDADLQFRVAISGHLIISMRNRGSHWPYVLDGALLRVEGPITRNGKFAEIRAGDIDQFHKIVHAK
jgi:hypothetical protein